MGYTFSLKNANAVGHLIEGNVYTFLDQTLSSNSFFDPNLEFLSDLIMKTERDFITSDIYWKSMSKDLSELRYEWKDIEQIFLSQMGEKNSVFDDRQSRSRLLNYLFKVSRLLSTCKVKTFLLPSFDSSLINDLLYSRAYLNRLVDIHPGDSALILQLKERIGERDISILNAFIKFETAYNKIEQWPGVLLWNENESLFIPVENEDDVYQIYDILKFERDSFYFLRHEFAHRLHDSKYGYIFHLSDLHFGNGIAERTKLRTIKILEKQLSELEDASTALPLITGDLMDSPNQVNKQAYADFTELLISKGFDQPIHILGNHDIDESGIFKRLTEEKAIISSLSTGKRIEIIESLGIALIKFNSNTGGILAQGEIGQEQLMEVGNELDSMLDKEKYTFMALLHHHPKEIENPIWYARDWYEKFLGKKKFEKTMKLNDADIFLEWIEQRGIKYILHGHKHIPNVHNHKDISIIAAGSSTGSVKHKEAGKTYLSYNLIKYDTASKKPVSVSIIAEEILGAGAKNILLHKL